MNRNELAAEIHQRLGYWRLSRAWAKTEILLGLVGAGIGLLLGQHAFGSATLAWELGTSGLALFVLGSYLTLAGHRSHLYQSYTEQLVLLVEEIRQLHSKGASA